MPVLRCTSKLLADIDDPPAADSVTPAPTPFGDWYGHLFSVERRKCVLFLNEPTLFVCPVFGVSKAEYRRIVPFFIDALNWTLSMTMPPDDKKAWVMDQHKYLTIGRTVNRSAVGSLNNRVADAKQMILWQGGFGICDLYDVTYNLNLTPMKPIGYSNGFEQMARLVTEAMGS